MSGLFLSFMTPGMRLSSSKKSDIPIAVLPELRDFPSAEYLEFSWGDRDYFPAPDAGVGLALKAAFWSSGSILHVVGFKEAVQEFFPVPRSLKSICRKKISND